MPPPTSLTPSPPSMAPSSQIKPEPSRTLLDQEANRCSVMMINELEDTVVSSSSSHVVDNCVPGRVRIYLLEKGDQEMKGVGDEHAFDSIVWKIAGTGRLEFIEQDTSLLIKLISDEEDETNRNENLELFSIAVEEATDILLQQGFTLLLKLNPFRVILILFL